MQHFQNGSVSVQDTPQYIERGSHFGGPDQQEFWSLLSSTSAKLTSWAVAILGEYLTRFSQFDGMVPASM